MAEVTERDRELRREVLEPMEEGDAVSGSWIEDAAARIAREHGIADPESIEAAIAETHLPVADKLLTDGLQIVGENARLRAQLARWRPIARAAVEFYGSEPWEKALDLLVTSRLFNRLNRATSALTEEDRAELLEGES